MLNVKLHFQLNAQKNLYMKCIKLIKKKLALLIKIYFWLYLNKQIN